jgi:ankyrin repeat protein
MLALYRHDTDRANQILAQSPELNVFEAAALGDTARLSEIISQNPSVVDAIADDGFHPLHLAAYFGKVDAARVLLAAGADPNAVAQNASRVRPIHSAASSQHLHIMRILLETGADPDAQQQGGWTALHSAEHQGNSDAMKLLLEHGASPKIRADDGRLPGDMRS